MKAMLTLGWLTLLVGTAAQADVKLPAIFGDHMVLQKGVKVSIWGWADAGEKVTLKALSQEQSAVADEKGKWKVTLDPLESADPFSINVSGKNSITLSDVLAGEVWVCSGQSNMEFQLNRASTSQPAVEQADRPKMRLFIAQHAFTNEPQENVKGGRWMECTPKTAAGFSAVGYFFGLQLHEKLDVPIGLIETNWGGTRAEAWIPKETFDRLQLPYEPQWTAEITQPPAQPAGSTRPARATSNPARMYQAPAALYNGMVAPLVGYGIRGVIWYQGETNAIHAEKYHDVMAGLIGSWRQKWGQGDFPFLVVQLANFQPNGGDWAALRAAQAQLASDVPNVGLALAIDIGESKDIHPKNKAEVGRRLALAAEKIAYGQEVVYSGPVFKGLKVDGAKAIVSFDHTDGGLMSNADTLQGFELAGEDGKYLPANATIDGETVVLTTEGVSAPKSVRYGWANDPICTLYNKAVLPAVPFQAVAK